MKKLIVCVIAFIVTTVIIFSAQTVAYYSDSVEGNIISITGSNLSGELIEITYPSDGSEPIVGHTPIKIIPGLTVKKSVTVKNTGDLSMYLRLTVDKEFNLSAENAGKDVDPSLVDLKINTEYWELRDGFYYYKHPVSEGMSTEPLFTEVNFSSKMGNTYTNSTITLRIKAYATQADNNGATVFDAQGWPAIN